MSVVGFRYSSPLIIPDASSIKDADTNTEMTYAFGALRTLALRIDETTGALSPTPDTWGTIPPTDSILGNNTNKFYAICSANIAFGAMVNFTNLSATKVQARPAKADNFANAAAGFCVTPGGFSTGQIGEFVVGPGINFGIAGLVPGTWYFLDPTSASGQVTATAPSVAGQIYQLIGQALTDSTLLVGSLNNWLKL